MNIVQAETSKFGLTIPPDQPSPGLPIHEPGRVLVPAPNVALVKS
jgi:hypothetical protein